MNSRPPLSGNDIENLLAHSRPAPVPADLMDRLVAAAPPAAERGVVRFLAWSSPLTAAAALVVWLHHGGPSPAPTDSPATAAESSEAAGVSVLTERESQRILVDAEDLGVIRDSLNRPVRLLRTLWIDDSTWSRPGAPPELRESSLRQEIVPVALPTY